MDDTTSTRKKKTAVFFCTHHAGHFNPILTLASMYVAAATEWQVHFFTCKSRQAMVEGIGAVFHHDCSAYENLHDACMQQISKLEAKPSVRVEGEFFPEQILPTTVAFLREGNIIARVKELDANVIVSDVSALWGVLAARVLKLPLITSCSCTLFETLEPAFGYMRELDFLKEAAAEIENDLGIKYDPMFSYMNESDFVIAWSFADYQPPSRRQQDHVHFYGCALPSNIDDHLDELAREDKQQSSEKSIMLFIENARSQGRRVIYCSLGTVVGQEKWTMPDQKGNTDDIVAEFYKVVQKTLGDSENYSVIVSIGQCRSLDDWKDKPDNFFVSQRVPQLLVLKHVVVFITHCGNNSVHEAFFLGTPMLCVPVFGDQHPNANMVELLNAGVQIASPYAPGPSPELSYVTGELLSAKLKHVLVDHNDKISSSCQQIQCTMRRLHANFHQSAMQEMKVYIQDQNKKLAFTTEAK